MLVRQKHSGARRAVAAVILAVLVAGQARADFYTLDGKFACLERGAASCAGHAADPLVAPPSTVPSNQAPSETNAQPPADDPLLKAPPTLTSHAPTKTTTPGEALRDIGARIEAGKQSADDLKRLRALARTGDGRAIELLAWCDYFGIGLPRDPVAAYILYGIASMAGVAGASDNQAVIYQYVLTPNQRQMVLDIQNDDLDFDTMP